MAIVKAARTVGNFTSSNPFVQTEEERNHIRTTYIVTGKLTVEPPVKTFDSAGNLVQNEARFTFADKAALDQYNNDPVIVAMKARYATIIQQANGTSEHGVVSED